MKLQITLPSKPGLLHFIPGLDLLALILVIPLMGASFSQQSGVAVNLPESSFRLQRIDNPVLITVSGGNPPRIWVNKKSVPMHLLERELEEMRNNTQQELITTALIQADGEVPHRVIMQLEDRILRMGLNCARIGRISGQ